MGGGGRRCRSEIEGLASPLKPIPFLDCSIWWVYVGTGDPVAGILSARIILVRDGRRGIGSFFYQMTLYQDGVLFHKSPVTYHRTLLLIL